MKNFAIFKNTKHKEGSKAPEYKISVKMGEEYVEAGGCWIKEGKSGKFFSCKLNDLYVDHTKNVARKGFELSVEGMTEVAKTYGVEVTKEESEDQIPF